MSNCNCTTDIHHDGSSQLARYLKALDPSYAPIDNRSMEDLLVFAKRYADQIQFYDIPGSVIDEGVVPEKVSWYEFFRRDMAVIAASIAILDVAAIKKEYDQIRQRLDEKPSPEVFAGLLNTIIAIAVRIDRWYTVAIPENPLRTDLDLAINSNLRLQLKRIVAYEEGFKILAAQQALNLDYSGIENDAIWGLATPVVPDASIYAGNTMQSKIKNAALYADELFLHFYSFISKVVTESDKYLTFALTQYPGHQPHMALFITFLKLFGLAQQQMNGLTEKMLDFYYKEVLHLTPKAAIPDKAHVVFELAKDVVEYGIAKDTALSAGADASGKEQLYKLQTDLVINQAQVKELKTIFIEKDLNDIKRIWARPIANSADGYGEPFTNPSPKWPAFGEGALDVHPLTHTCKLITENSNVVNFKNETQIGFAIASPQLLLQGGNRIIALTITVVESDLVDLSMLDKLSEIWLSAEEGWLKMDKTKIITDNAIRQNIKKVLNDGGDISTIMPMESMYFFDLFESTIYICLPVVEKAIVSFNPEQHSGKAYSTSHAVMQLMIGPDIKIKESSFRNLTINNLSLAVRVGSSIQSQGTPTLNFSGIVTHKDENNIVPLPGVKVAVFESAEKETTTDGQGKFVIETSVNKVLVFELADYKTLYLRVPYNVGEVNVILQSGSGLDPKSKLAYAYVTPPFLDGLKKLTLQNDDGLIDSNKPFDPFTSYPKLNSAFYIGSDEAFNKPLNELEIYINHQINATDVDVTDLSINEFNNEKIKLKVSLRENREWKDLYTKEGEISTDYELQQNILYQKKDSEPNYLLTLKRTPLSYSTEFTNQTLKGFIQLQNKYIPLNTSGYTNEKNIFERMAEMALLFKIKEISVSYFSKLENLDPEIDQFFHVYPFGIVETQLIKIDNEDPITEVGKEKVLEFTTSSISVFNKLNNLPLVNASNLLLPQFTYQSPYIDSTKKYNQYSGPVQEEGMLYIGLEKAMPLQAVSLLFQFAEGSAADEDNDPPKINWSYLTNNEWRPLRGEDVVSDTTQGFQTTGIVQLNVPADATTNNTIITEGLHWFLASVTENSNRIPQLIDVAAQAATVVFTDQNNDSSHYDKALLAGSINKLALKVAEISAVKQPFASFDGKHKEVGKTFYTRVSERLRHKGRAINAWDYEHLVLNRFPGIYKVKCITHTDPNCLCRTEIAGVYKLNYIKQTGGFTQGNDDYKPDEESQKKLETALDQLSIHTTITVKIIVYAKSEEKSEAEKIRDLIVSYCVAQGITLGRIATKIPEGPLTEVDIQLITCCGPQVAPGHVLIVPIADLKNLNCVNPLQPKTSRGTLLEIEAYLKKLTSPFVKVHAKNPVYEQISVQFKVQFLSGTDKGFYLKKLNDEIVHYLTPWAFDVQAEIKFGQEVFASSIINFIEERSYVDFITEFIMRVCKADCCPITDDNGEDTVGITMATPSTARSILVSAPQHRITPYEGTPVTPGGTRQRGVTSGEKKQTASASLPVPSQKIATAIRMQTTNEEVIEGGMDNARPINQSELDEPSVNTLLPLSEKENKIEPLAETAVAEDKKNHPIVTKLITLALSFKNNVLKNF